MNLTQAASFTKKVTMIFGVVLVVVITAWNSYNFWYNSFYLPNKPEQILEPDSRFGLLPYPQLPQTIVNSADITYSIDTPTGKLPIEESYLSNVYFVPQEGTTLLAPDRARVIAKNLNFNLSASPRSPTEYVFQNDRGGELIININTGNFDFRRQTLNAGASPNPGDLMPDEESLINGFRIYLGSKSLLKGTLESGRAKAVFDTGNAKTSKNAVISIWPKDIGGLPIVTANYEVGLVYANYSIQYGGEDRYTRLSYTYWEPDENNYSTYPIKTTEQAFEELKQGRGTVVIEPPNKKASVTNAYLALYEPLQYSPYIQPVFVFEGDRFAAYVPAIPPEYLEALQP